MRIGTVSLYTLNSIPFFGYPIELLWTSPQRRRGARHRSCETSGPWCPGVSKLSHAWIDVMMFPFWLMLFVVCLYTCTEPRSNTANLSFWNLDFWPLKLPFLNLLDQFAEHLDFSYSFPPVLLCHICRILGFSVAGAASFRDRLAARFQLLRSRLWGTEGLGGGEKPGPWMVP